ncbi:hypothetical protein L1887_47728 [Cichorium endivia]|nr:hypothetical protein L1887_47728 [Cichorium endivia]
MQCSTTGRLGGALLERAEGEWTHDLSMHLVDEFDGLGDGVVPGLDLPCLVSGAFALFERGILPDVEDGVESSDLGEPGADGLYELATRLEAAPPVLLPLEQMAGLEVVRPELVQAVGGARGRRGPEAELLGEPVGSIAEQRAQLLCELLKVCVLSERRLGLVVSGVAVVLPDVVERLEVTDDHLPRAGEAHGQALGGELGGKVGDERTVGVCVAGQHRLALDLVDVLAACDLHRVRLRRDALGLGLVGAVQQRLEQALLWLCTVRAGLLLLARGGGGGGGALVCIDGARRDDERARGHERGGGDGARGPASSGGAQASTGEGCGHCVAMIGIGEPM